MPAQSQSISSEIVFTLSSDQAERYRAWRREVDEKVAEGQVAKKEPHKGKVSGDHRLEVTRRSLARGEPLPDYGCIGGAYTFLITPNSLGIAVKVRNTVSGDEIDLTEYETW